MPGPAGQLPELRGRRRPAATRSSHPARRLDASAQPLQAGRVLGAAPAWRSAARGRDSRRRAMRTPASAARSICGGARWKARGRTDQRRDVRSSGASGRPLESVAPELALRRHADRAARRGGAGPRATTPDPTARRAEQHDGQPPPRVRDRLGRSVGERRRPVRRRARPRGAAPRRTRPSGSVGGFRARAKPREVERRVRRRPPGGGAGRGAWPRAPALASRR